MKRGLLVLLFALITGVCAFALMRSQKAAGHSGAPLLDVMPELAWVREDLDLTDLQFAKVSELHAAYRPKCVEMCRLIAEAHERMNAAARDADGISPALEVEIKDHARIHAECQRTMLDHLYRTAAVLDENQARRYLDTMLPYALDFSHSEPEGKHSP